LIRRLQAAVNDKTNENSTLDDYLKLVVLGNMPMFAQCAYKDWLRLVADRKAEALSTAHTPAEAGAVEKRQPHRLLFFFVLFSDTLLAVAGEELLLKICHAQRTTNGHGAYTNYVPRAGKSSNVLATASDSESEQSAVPLEKSKRPRGRPKGSK
jgi:hypothetical protein